MSRRIMTVVVLVCLLAIGGSVWMVVSKPQQPSGPVTEVAPSQRIVPTPSSPKSGINAPTIQRVNVAKSPYWDKPLLLPEYVGATPNELPVVLREWLDAWKEAELGGKSANVKQIESLGLLLLRDDVPSLCAVQTINLIAELDGWDAVKPIVAPVTGKAVASLSGLTVGNRTGRPLLNSLWAMEDNVWAAKDWPLAETLLAALLPFETAGSGHAQAAAYSHAESVYMLKRYDQALIEFNAIMNARATASEPSDGINRALDWELGLCLYYMARYAEALPHFQATTANTGTPEAKEAWPFAIVCLARTGNLVGANALLDRWIETCRPDVAAVTPILKAIKDPALAIGAPSPSANGM